MGFSSQKAAYQAIIDQPRSEKMNVLGMTNGTRNKIGTGASLLLASIMVFATLTAAGALAQEGMEEEGLDLETIYVVDIEEAVESVGFKPLVTRTAGPWGKKAILDTPYSINVMSSDLLKNAGVSSFDEIAKMNPLVQLKYPNASPRGTAFFNIRGFNLGQANGRKQNGIRRLFYGIPMEDKERVEVLSGLSGFLYGPTNVGGAVNFVTKRPTNEAFGSLILGFRDRGAPYGHLDFGGPIDKEGRYAYRFNAAGRNGQTAVRNQKQLNAMFSGAFDFHVTQDLLLRFAASHYENRNDNGPAEWRLEPGAKRPSAPSPKSKLAIGSSDKRIQDDFEAELDWKINEIFTVRAAFLYSDMDLPYRNYMVNRIMPDGSIVQALNFGFDNPETPINQIGGYIYVDSSFSTGWLDHKLTFGFSKDDLHLRMINPPNTTQIIGPILDQRTANANYMIGDEISWGDSWKFLLGANQSEFKVVNNLNLTTNKKSRLSPTASVLFKPLKNWTLYGTYMESLEPGGYVPGGYRNAGQYLTPYVSQQYELGAKAELGDMLLTLALFDIDKAYQYDINHSDGTKSRTSDGRERHQGLEFTATGKIMEHLRLYGGFTLMEAKIKKDTNNKVNGKTPVDVAEKMIKLYAEYDTPFLSGLTVNGGAYYTGSMYGDNLNTDKIPSVITFDMGLSYRAEIKGMPARLNFLVQNIADKQYWLSNQYLGAPRTFMLTAQFDFL
jgi:iron complex outermembrane receptor protein